MRNNLRSLTLDAQGLAFVQGQAYRVNQTLYEARYPDWDFGRLIYVDTTGPAWSPGVMTYFSDMTGKANWQSGYAKDIPLADVSQSMELRGFQLAAIGYQWNIEEVNTAIQIGGALPDRRARAARLAYQQFMYNLTLRGDVEKGMTGLINYTGVNISAAPADGTGGVRFWVNASGVGTKTPDKIVRDINLAIQGVYLATNTIALADTILLPVEAFNYIAGTPYSATTQETILSFVLRTNIYTIMTGRPLTIRTVPELGTAGTNSTNPTSVGKGRMVAYRNDPNSVKLHLPLPHTFLEMYRDGPLNFVVPGIFRTGGVEVMDTLTMRYVDGISETPSA